MPTGHDDCFRMFNPLTKEAVQVGKGQGVGVGEFCRLVIATR